MSFSGTPEGVRGKKNKAKKGRRHRGGRKEATKRSVIGLAQQKEETKEEVDKA